jgi:hypothetical protein
MLKHINILLLIAIVGGIIFYNISEPEPVVQVENCKKQTPDPGSDGDEYEEIKELLGSEKASTE